LWQWDSSVRKSVEIRVSTSDARAALDQPRRPFDDEVAELEPSWMEQRRAAQALGRRAPTGPGYVNGGGSRRGSS
jgi:hypothetical protein